MPPVKAHADVFRDWDAVLGACAQNASLIPGVDPLKAELEAFLALARDLKIQQETLEGRRRAITQQLEKALDDGRESVRKIRAFTIVHMGSANKALTQFGVHPRKVKGTPRKKTPGTPPPTVGTADPSTHKATQVNDGKEANHA